MTPEEPRAPTQQELKSEIASIDKDITRVLFYGGGVKILENADETLRTRGGSKGLRIYDELKRDCRAGPVLAKRKHAITSREWHVVPASDKAEDVEVAEFVEQALKPRFDKLCKDLLEATLKGYSVVEIMWAVDGDRIVPAKFKKRSAGRFVLDLQDRLRMLTPSRMIEGEELPDRKFILHRHEADDDNPYGQGIGRALFWPVFFKRQNMTFWLTFNDKWGSPTPLGKYPGGTSKDQQTKLLDALRRISQDAGVIVPIGMEVELLKGAAAGDGGSFNVLMDYLDGEITTAVLGEQLTTAVGDSGSRALGDVHQAVRRELAKDDADALSETLNQTLIKWLVEYNFPGRAQPTVWRIFDEPEDQDAAVKRDVALDGLGWRPTEERIRDVYGDGYERKPEPTPADPNLQPGTATSQPPAAPPNVAEFSEPASQERWYARLGRMVSGLLRFGEADPVTASRERNRVDQEAIANAADLAAEQWQPLMKKRVDDLFAILDETKDLAMFRERLAELLDTDPAPEVIAAIQRHTFTAQLAGRTPAAKG